MTPPTSAHTHWEGPGAPRVAPGRGIPFGSSSVQHGTAVFEGIRCYAGARGPALFRLDDHLLRLLNSARLLGIRHDHDLPRLRAATLSAAAASGFADAYVRPGLFATDPILSIDLSSLPFTLGVEVWPVAAPPSAPAAAEPGVRLTVSPWRRPSPATFPPRAKAVGTYVTSALAKTAAVTAGFDDALQLDCVTGRVAEATVSNVFLVRQGRLCTPWLADSLLAGITRDTVLTLARDLGIEVAEEPVDVGDVRAAQEVFLTGTASELVPVASLDGHRYAPERPVFDAIAAAFRATVTGRAGHPEWRTPVAAPRPDAPAALAS
ncbi:aminotransferase class IV [Streptomyces lunalinharesii]|uniref:Branched-chain-amino-acid transaminase n=1 Tax=Streptomyces lunalinharesii TaxID=333384 RepID=A0ABN3SVQ8_9ACTN